LEEKEFERGKETFEKGCVSSFLILPKITEG